MGVDSVYHVFQSVSLSDEPPLRPKDVSVRAPDCLGSSDSVKTLANLCAAGDEIPVEVVTLRRYGLEAEAANWRPHAEAFADDGLKVGQRLDLRPGNGGADSGGGAADFVDEGNVCWWGGDEGEESHAEGVGGGVGARDAAGCLVLVFWKIC